jgi:hypothetical protein
VARGQNFLDPDECVKHAVAVDILPPARTVQFAGGMDDFHLAAEPIIGPVGHQGHGITAFDDGRINGVKQQNAHDHADDDEEGSHDGLVHKNAPKEWVPGFGFQVPGFRF